MDCSVIFLDPDNVLKTTESIEVLRRIIAETGCKIVVTSDWKKPFEDETTSDIVESIRKIWMRRNFPGKVIDVTPNLSEDEILEMHFNLNMKEKIRIIVKDSR